MMKFTWHEFFTWLTNIDRRWIYLLMAVVVVLPLFFSFSVKVKPTKTVNMLYDFIENLEPGNTILLAFDYSPDSLAELNPMGKAVVYHAFKKGIRVMGIALAWPSAAGLGLDVIQSQAFKINLEIMDEKLKELDTLDEIKKYKEDKGLTDDEVHFRIMKLAAGIFERNQGDIDLFPELMEILRATGGADEFEPFKEEMILSGVDYTYFGYKPGYVSIMLGMGKDMVSTLNTDYRSISLMKYEMFNSNTNKIKNYEDVSLVVDLAAGGSVAAWVVYVNTKFGRPVAAGVTAVMAADYYPYIQSGQLIGLLNGMRGAADYETLNMRHFPDTAGPGKGLGGMASQTWAHIMILVFILLGNIGYFVTKKGGEA